VSEEWDTSMIEALEKWQEGAKSWEARALAAEKRVAEVEAVLRDILADAKGWHDIAQPILRLAGKPPCEPGCREERNIQRATALLEPKPKVEGGR
jgi:hypothetical protein